MMRDIAEMTAEFEQLLRSTGRDGVEEVLQDLHSYGFFEAPASAGHHLNTEGGLVRHSLNTFRIAERIWEGLRTMDSAVDSSVKRENLIIAALLHDVCKSDIYRKTVRKRRTPSGTYVDVDGYSVTYRSFPMGHGEKSVTMLLLSGMALTDAEMLAIRWHMGAWSINMTSIEEVKNCDAARMLHPLVPIIQCADSLAASVIETTPEDIDAI